MLTIDIIIGMLLVSSISMGALGLYGIKFSRRIPAALPYSLLMFAAAGWAIFYALDLSTSSLSQKVLYHNLRFLFLPFIPLLELWLVIAYVRKPEWLSKNRVALLLVIPFLAVIGALTSPFHALFRYNFSLDLAGPVTVLQYTEGPFYQLYFLYSLALLVLTLVILVYETYRKETLMEVQTVLLLIALAFPTIVNYLYIAGITPVFGVNMTTPLLWIAAILYTVALFRYRFLDIIPIARSRLIESMGTPMLVLDTGGRVIDLNPAACTLFSTTLAKAVGKPVNGIAPDWLDFLSLCLSEETSRTDLVRDQDGGARFYEGSVELIRTSSGEPEGRLVLLQDVTERKLAEKRVVHLASFPELTPVLVLEADLHGSILYANPAMRKATDMMGESDPRIFIPQDIRDGFNGTATGKSVQEVREIEIHGRVFRENVYFTPEFSSLRVYANDITDRKKAEQEIARIAREWEVTFNATSDGICLIDMNQQIQRCNARMIEILGGTRHEDLVGKPCWAIIHKTTGPIPECPFVSAKKTLTRTQVEIPAGDLWFEVTADPILDSSGTFTGAVHIMRDITDRKRAEDALRQVNKQLNLLSSITRHDILNQLMALKGYLYLSKEMIDDPMTLAGYIQKEEQAANTIERQISFTWDYQELGVAAPEWQNVNASIEKALTGLPMRAVRVETDPNNPAIFADRLFEKVFYNLIDNALRYGGAGMKTIRVFSHETDAGLLIVCEDDGVGISAEDKKKLFTRGFGKNTGLGLFLSREILGITGITITENGTPGTGARFEITVPKGTYRFTGADDK